MVEILIYTVTGILLYFLAEAALNWLEAMHGEPIPNRNVVFFVIILFMAISLFQVIQLMFAG